VVERLIEDRYGPHVRARCEVLVAEDQYKVH
jgi:hypothetical protein